MTTRIETENSVYELDEINRRVRRIEGHQYDNSQWPEDLMVWREYTQCDPGYFGRMIVVWSDSTVSLTSEIKGAEEVA